MNLRLIWQPNRKEKNSKYSPYHSLIKKSSFISNFLHSPTDFLHAATKTPSLCTKISVFICNRLFLLHLILLLLSPPQFLRPHTHASNSATKPHSQIKPHKLAANSSLHLHSQALPHGSELYTSIKGFPPSYSESNALCSSIRAHSSHFISENLTSLSHQHLAMQRQLCNAKHEHSEERKKKNSQEGRRRCRITWESL